LRSALHPGFTAPDRWAGKPRPIGLFHPRDAWVSLPTGAVSVSQAHAGSNKATDRHRPPLIDDHLPQSDEIVTRTPLGNRLALSALTIALTLGIAACGSKDEKKPATQVAAKVNAEEISVHQINFILNRNAATANIAPEQAPKIRREILDKLIDQQLAVEQALAKKLDRSPDVVMALEAARREVLARAYVDQLSAGLGKPTPEDAKAYYAAHPQLFAERRVYNIQEIVVPVAGGTAPALREMLAAGKTMDDIASWLKGKAIKFSGASATRAAEQIPLELLPKVHALKDGQGLVLENGASITVMRVIASQSAPIAEAAALPRVAQFLGNQRAAQAAERELKELKAKAKISYQGEFAHAADGAPAVAATTTPVAAPADKSAIEKGVAGLK
jgi:EpsD family peptidyl-prolyl cis-trans isomerase